MACRENLETYLAQRGIAYEIQHNPPVFTAPRVAASEHIPGKKLVKVVMVFAGEQLAMLVLSGHFDVDLRAAGTALGVREVRLAREDEFAAAFPDCEPGTMPPLGNLYGIPVHVEEALEEDESIVFQVGTHTDTMTISYRDFARLARPKVHRLGFVPGKSTSRLLRPRGYQRGPARWRSAR
jgi:Ala-tRNA(Pro) deacylase